MNKKGKLLKPYFNFNVGTEFEIIQVIEKLSGGTEYFVNFGDDIKVYLLADYVQVLKPQTELEQFITYINSNLDKLREGSATRKAVYSIVRLYTDFRKGQQ